MENTLTVKKQSNPFEPRYVLAEVQIKPGCPLAEYCLPFEREYGDGENLVVVHNGREIAPLERGVIVPRVGDQIIIKPKVQGGILRIFAFIALMVVAIIAAPGLATLLTNLTPWTFSAGLVAGGLMVAGGILLNVLLPPPTPSIPDQTTNYNWSGPTMTSKEGIPICRGYGTFRVGGNVIASYTDTADPKGYDQFLNILISM